MTKNKHKLKKERKIKANIKWIVGVWAEGSTLRQRQGSEMMVTTVSHLTTHVFHERSRQTPKTMITITVIDMRVVFILMKLFLIKRKNLRLIAI